MNLAVRASLALLLALAVTPALADPPNFPVRSSNGSTPTIAVYLLPDGSVAPKHVLVNPQTGFAFGPTDGLPVVPAIAAVGVVDGGGIINTAGQARQVFGSDNLRKGGWITADPNNTGYLYISFTATATTQPGAGNQCVLSAGSSCPLTINGYVIQTIVSLAGSVAGDAFSAASFR